MKKISSMLKNEKVVPVVVIDDQAQALGLAKALLDGGINSIEITLRNKYGLKAIELVKDSHPNLTVIAGTVSTCDDMRAVVKAGADAIVSPGVTTDLLECATELGVPYLPGVATPSDIIRANTFGVDECKLFPASVVGGISALKAFSGPFQGIKFCPTGGIDGNNYLDYLALGNVMFVGGSWIAPSDLIKVQDWDEITKRSKLVTAV